MVVDADALLILGRLQLSPSNFQRILTPHHVEAARLLQLILQRSKDPWSTIENLTTSTYFKRTVYKNRQQTHLDKSNR